MFDELKNVNIDACSDSELIALRSQTLSAFNLHMQATQELVRRCNNNDNQTTIPEEIHKPQKIAIANGRKLSEGELSNINEDDFDIILNLTTTSLRYRQDPTKHSKLIEAKLQNIGTRRIEILSHFLEHPSKDISIESASLLPKQPDIVEPNALSKTISLLRRALGQSGSKGPYILTKAVWGRNYRYAYQMNPKWKYLLIKE